MVSRCRSRVGLSRCVGLLLIAWAGIALAQPLGGPRFVMPEAAALNPSGTVDAVGPGMIQIKSIAGDPWILRLAERANILLAGTAKKDVLSPGTFVSFVAEVDTRKSEVQAPVDKLTIFTPSPERPLGAFPGGAATVGGGAADALGPNPFGADAALGPQALGAAPQSAEGRPSRTRRRQSHGEAQEAVPPVGTFEIVGRITSIDKSGKLTVYAPNPYFRPAVQFELSEDPEIDLDLTGPGVLQLVRPGDKVVARGRQMGQNVVQADQVTITLAEPFTMVDQSEGDAKKPPRRTSRSSRTRHAEQEREKAEKAEKTGKPAGPEAGGETPKANAADKADGAENAAAAEKPDQQQPKL